MSNYGNEREFKVLIGETIVSITGAEEGSDRISIVTASGKRYEMYHDQSCCESVSINEVHGDVYDLVGFPILYTEESSNSDIDKPNEYSDSWTWTFYRLTTIKGSVTIRWLGESNGYYSESVTLYCKVEPYKY